MIMLHPLRICSTQEMREIDAYAESEFDLDSALLMENAGRAASQIILEKFPKAGNSSEILVFAGKGRNAGDAFVAARRLMCLERNVRIFHLASEDQYMGATLKNFSILKKMNAKLTYIDAIADLQEFLRNSNGPYLIIDGIFGTGLKLGVEGLFHDVVETINELNTDVVSLDIPSGVSGDTGDIHGTCISAALTISFGFPKLGHFLPPGAPRRGELINVDISLPAKFRKEGKTFLLTKSPMSALLKERDRYGHKNSFGHTLLIGGSPGRIGAIVMAARASHKMGTGLVTAATWPDSFESLSNKMPPETMGFPLHLSGPEYQVDKSQLPHYSSIVVGPGLGLRAEGKNLLQALLENYRGPIVIDADALNLISDHHLYEHLTNRRAPTVLTPHPGEMARLLGVSKDEVMRSPVECIQKTIALTHSIVLLKGAATLISSPDEVLYLNHYPNDGMATAGSGDVLAGMIGGLLGQNVNPFSGTLLGVYLHSLAGDFAAKTYGHRSMTAPDIIENIGQAFKDLKSTECYNLNEGRINLL